MCICVCYIFSYVCIPELLQESLVLAGLWQYPYFLSNQKFLHFCEIQLRCILKYPRKNIKFPVASCSVGLSNNIYEHLGMLSRILHNYNTSIHILLTLCEYLFPVMRFKSVRMCEKILRVKVIMHRYDQVH